MKRQVSVLLPDGSTRHFTQQVGESLAEMQGRVLCTIEEIINKGQRGPTPKGTRWAEWWHEGHPLPKAHFNGLGDVRESTGNPYADRTVMLPGLYSYEEAKCALGEASP